MVKTITVVMTAALLCACGSGPRGPNVARYACGALAVTAAFNGQDKAALTISGRTYGLSRAMAASGARYDGGAGDDYVEFWEHQGTARLTLGRVVYPECRKEG